MRVTSSVLILIIPLLFGSACVPSGAPSRATSPAPTATAIPPRTLKVEPNNPTVGTLLTATAEGLPPGAKVNLLWKTVQGGWVIKDYYHFDGKKFTETSQTLGQAVVDSGGHLTAQFRVPNDYGGVHDIIASSGGVALAQGGTEVKASFEMTPTEGPIGTLIEIKVQGLGWRTMESTWDVNWDNKEVGWISAVDSRGSATARLRAAGPVGDHILKVYTGYMGQSYLNYEQAPTAYLPRPQFVFHTLPGGQVPPSYAEPYPPQPVPAPATTGAKASLSPTQGPVNTHTVLTASGLPANQAVSLVWETWVGSRVSQEGYTSTEKTIGNATTGSNGTLSVPITIPDDLGGRHLLSIQANGKELARAYFVIETSIVSISPIKGTVGTTITIHLKGVGWTEYDNIMVATYDNAYMGYACGFNSQGDVVIHFAATGTPGIHLIDLYPGIYEGPAGGQQLYRLPQLTYADDHPGNKIPALRFAFEVTP